MKIKFKPIKPVLNEKPPSLADVDSHTNDGYKKYRAITNKGMYHEVGGKYGDETYQRYVMDPMHLKYGESDKMTRVHETTHGVNNDVANGPGGGRSGCVGLYCLNDVAFTIKENTGLTISKVAHKIPESFRGGVCKVYDLYCVSQAKDWGDQPLYLCDEWVAYTNGGQAALELANDGDMDSNHWSDLQNAVYFNMFVCVLRSMAPPNKELDEMISFQLGRVDALVESFKTVPVLHRGETETLLQEFYSSEYYKPFKGGKKIPGYGFEEYL